MLEGSFNLSNTNPRPHLVGAVKLFGPAGIQDFFIGRPVHGLVSSQVTSLLTKQSSQPVQALSAA
jgi:hypothetical protein